jgi:uncharacterized protein involved in exopolysaccharide biosynthesis
LINDAELYPNDEISVFALGTVILRNRRRITGWMFAGGLLAVLSVVNQARLYKATASFMPQGSDGERSVLSGLAGQFGMSIPRATSPNSPEFYSTLLRSPVLLRDVAADTLSVAEEGGRRAALVDLLQVEGEVPGYREDLAVRRLQSIVNPSVDNTTGIVEFSVATQWPSVSQQITSSLVEGVNAFNQRSRQSQAAAERAFLEERLSVANTELRAAENRLQHFMTSNRRIGSPELVLERERLDRLVLLRQQVVLALNQSYEDAQLREVRNTPLITLIETPRVPTMPEPRGRVRKVIIGMLIGAVLAVGVAFFSFVLGRRRLEGNAEVEEFFNTLDGLKGNIRRRLPWSRRGARV